MLYETNEFVAGICVDNYDSWGAASTSLNSAAPTVTPMKVETQPPFFRVYNHATLINGVLNVSTSYYGPVF